MTLAEWRFSGQLAWQDLFIRWVTIGTAALAVITSVFVLWKVVPEGLRSGVVTMHYTIYLGIDDVRSWPWLLLVPAGLIGVFAVNLSIALGLFRSDALAARALVGLSAALVIIASVSSFFFVSINL